METLLSHLENAVQGFIIEDFEEPSSDETIRINIFEGLLSRPYIPTSHFVAFHTLTYFCRPGRQYPSGFEGLSKARLVQATPVPS
jgi:hypothetical protein